MEDTLCPRHRRNTEKGGGKAELSQIWSLNGFRELIDLKRRQMGKQITNSIWTQLGGRYPQPPRDRQGGDVVLKSFLNCKKNFFKSVFHSDS